MSDLTAWCSAKSWSVANEKGQELSLFENANIRPCRGAVVPWCRGAVVPRLSVRTRNKRVMSSNHARITIKTPLVRNAKGDHLMKSISLEIRD